MGSLIFIIAFFSTPFALLVLTGIGIFRFAYAKQKVKKCPGSYTERQIRTRKHILILVSILTGLAYAAMATVIYLFFLALSYM